MKQFLFKWLSLASHEIFKIIIKVKMSSMEWKVFKPTFINKLHAFKLFHFSEYHICFTVPYNNFIVQISDYSHYASKICF